MNNGQYYGIMYRRLFQLFSVISIESIVFRRTGVITSFEIRRLTTTTTKKVCVVPLWNQQPSDDNQQFPSKLLDGILSRADRTLEYTTGVDDSSSVREAKNVVNDIFSKVRQNTNKSTSASSGLHTPTSSENTAPIDAIIIEENEIDIGGKANELLQDVSSRAMDMLTSNSDTDLEQSDRDYNNNNISSVRRLASSETTVTAQDIAMTYGSNPTITMTALAHSLWSHIIRPDIDTVIDATAGNGGDAMVLAKMLFTACHNDNDDEKIVIEDTKSQLLAIDIQEKACQNTARALSAVVPPEILENNIKILHTSHTPLPLPKDTTSVALIVYNLGFLPRSKKEFMTQTETTIASLADAALLLRIGGMISVMTYPQTNKEEDMAVRTFLESLALFSSNTLNWEKYVKEQPFDETLKERLRITLQHVLDEGGTRQTWRVHEHKKLGWIDAPILLTATRIK